MKFYIRQAAAEDMKRVFDLSNDPIVREVSFSNRVITWEEHVEWYRKAIIRDDLVFLLGFTDESMETDFVGQIRYRLTNSQDAEISISLQAEYRSRGVGRQLLESSLEHLRNHTGVRRVLAQIKSTNEASDRFFRKSGFQNTGNPLEDRGDILLLTLEL